MLPLISCLLSGLDIDTTYFWLVKHHPEYWPEAGPPPAYEPRPLLAPPGTKYLYANVGYTLLTMIAARAAGRPFDVLLRPEVLQPLGLGHTLPERNGVRVPGRARGYTRRDGRLQLSEQGTADIVGASDLVTTADDLARFDAAFDDDRFVPEPLRAAMLTPHVRARQASEIPRTASRNCHRISGRSGLPKFRQSVTPCGRAPT